MHEDFSYDASHSGCVFFLSFLYKRNILVEKLYKIVVDKNFLVIFAVDKP